jgi:hypothetical protein
LQSPASISSHFLAGFILGHTVIRVSCRAEGIAVWLLSPAMPYGAAPGKGTVPEVRDRPSPIAYDSLSHEAYLFEVY